MTAPDPSCLFCRFVSREITPDVVAETEHSLAFRDINPQAPTRLWKESPVSHGMPRQTASFVAWISFT